MDFSLYDHPAPDVTSEEIGLLAGRIYGVEGRVEPLPGDRDSNFSIDDGRRRYVLKVGNRGDHDDSLVAQAAAIDWVLDRDPTFPIAGVVRTVDDKPTGELRGHRLLLTEYVDGQPVRSRSATPGFRRALGRLTARLSLALSGFNHPFLARVFPWSLPQLAELRPLVAGLGSVRLLVESELDHFDAQVAPALRTMATQAIHGDLNSDNVVVEDDDPESVAGLFDMGDISYAPPIVDLAVAAAYQSADSNPLVALSQMAPAFHMVRPLRAEEARLLPDLVAARCAQSLLMSARQAAVNPDNTRYVTADREVMAQTLSWFNDANRKSASEEVVAACSLGSPVDGDGSEPARLRARAMFSGYRLSYSDPVQASSARGVWITERTGRRLLDCYNNVPHVGHGHPRVVAALSSQVRELNTNTRYLAPRVADYAARLADLFPDPLEVVFFTNSGSEANDLAYRLATTATGREVAVTSANAYHGATTVTAAMSPDEHDTSRLAGQTRHIDLSADLNGESVGDPSFGPADDVAMAIVDTIFSSEGIHDAPQLLGDLDAWAKHNGTLLVADEVQAGFGRVGSKFWGFGDVVPDIVTLGKPIGNGYPMGAVVTTRAIADSFAADSSYFSTFAGSPVAAAAGSAVLDVVEGEGLAGHAESLGRETRRVIAGWEHPSVVDVRGAGLFIGVEMKGSEAASGVVDDMRRRGVLIGRTGPGGDVLKIRPPLVIQRFHIEKMLSALQDSLATTL